MKKTVSAIFALHLFFICMLTCFGVLASTVIPSDLQPWQSWVLKGYEEKLCPVPYNNGEQHICVWPTSVTLTLTAQKGQFTQKVTSYKEGWNDLPGDKDHWPKEIKVNDKNYPISSHEGNPSVWLAAGSYKIEGFFEYDQLPDYISIPSECGLLTLSLSNQLIDQPDRDLDGKVWLRRPISSDQNSQSVDSLSIRVFRLFDDSIPMQETTQLILRVSGDIREVSIGPVLLPNTVPLALESSLPAKLEDNGMLRLQLKPGLHTVTVRSRYDQKMDALSFIAKPIPWPKEEIWSFKSENALRLVELTGAPVVDPEQAGVPDEFAHFPAYLMRDGMTLTLIEKHRGQMAHSAEQLQLQRIMWLHFSGKGFTVQDVLTGTMEQHWRLQQMPPLILESVSINGKAQLITQLTPQDSPGVEIREGQLHLMAMSQIQGHPFKLPAIGWDFDVKRLATTLILPPGWMLLSAWGVDSSSEAWVQQWSLLDLFLVFIIAAAMLKLLGLTWGVISALTLILIYQEPGAPIYSWLNVIAVLALLKVLPAGRAQWVSRWYFRASFVWLIILVVPFMVYLIRTAIYPQLAYVNAYQIVSIQQEHTRETLSKAMPLTVPQANQTVNASGEPMSAVAKGRFLGNKTESAGLPPLQDYAPNAKVQTGPGIPNWQWNVFNLQWNGPVLKDQKVTLWLLPSWATSLCKFFAVGLMAMFIYGLSRPVSRQAFSSTPSLGSLSGKMLIVVAGICLAGGTGFFPNNAYADFPPEPLLDKLRDRLLEGPNCLPDCADISQLQVNINGNQLSLRMRAQVSASTAIPLPSAINKWMPRSVLINTVPASDLYYASNGQLWVNLAAGVHDLLIEGPIGQQEKFELPMPLPPKNIQVNSQGWEVTGVYRHQLQGENLYFSRVGQVSNQSGEQNKQFESGRIPAFVTLIRTLRLGQDWTIINELKRIAPLQGAISVQIPLLAGEQILTEAVPVNNGNAFISLAENQSEFTWQSKLKITEKIILKANAAANIQEKWHLDALPRWHCTFEGIPLIHQNQQNRWFPSWQPWPNEVVAIAVQRPEAVPGNTFTIDESHLLRVQGHYASTNVLRLAIRSTQGENHAIQIGTYAQLQEVLINGLSQPINIKNGEIVLPVAPGSQTMEIKWQELTGEHIIYRTPIINLKAPSSNATLEVQLSQNRWLLFLRGPVMGPAILFWGVLIVIVLGALGLGKSGLTPLKSWQWCLLGIGLVIATPLSIIFVVAWFVAMHYRGKQQKEMNNKKFNWIQIGLVCLTIAFVVSLFTSISEGLLGLPHMQIQGPHLNSVATYSYVGSAYDLRWYQDLTANNLPRAWVISLPLYVYRILMLFWALWLAFSLVRWMRWGWNCFSAQGYWSASQSKVD